MIWGYPYFWNHPNGVFSAKVLLATFGLAMEFFTVSEFPFSWEVYQIWEQEGARLGWWRISILKNAGWFLIRCWPLFPCFYCAKKLYKSPCQVWKICDVWNGIVIQHFCDIWKIFCMYIYRWLYMTHDYIYMHIFDDISKMWSRRKLIQFVWTVFWCPNFRALWRGLGTSLWLVTNPVGNVSCSLFQLGPVGCNLWDAYRFIFFVSQIPGYQVVCVNNRHWFVPFFWKDGNMGITSFNCCGLMTGLTVYNHTILKKHLCTRTIWKNLLSAHLFSLHRVAAQPR